MSVQLAKRPITVDEYHRMTEVGILTENDKVELIQGEIIKKSPIGSKHAAFVNRFTNILKEHPGNRAIVSVQNPLRINDLNEPEPDVAILKYVEDYYVDKHPTPKDIYILLLKFLILL